MKFVVVFNKCMAVLICDYVVFIFPLFPAQIHNYLK